MIFACRVAYGNREIGFERLIWELKKHEIEAVFPFEHHTLLIMSIFF